MLGETLTWHAALAALETRLIATWVLGPRFRETWTPTPSEFGSPRTRALATACAALAARGTEPGDVSVWLVAELARSGDLKRLWPAGEPPLPVDPFPDPTRRLGEWSSLRTLFALRQRLLESVLGWGTGTDLGAARSSLLEAITAAYVSGPVPAYSDGELMALALEGARAPRASGVYSGLAELDRVTGGIRPGHVWAVGAPTNWGKSSLLLAVLDHNIEVHGARSLLVTCEDAPELLGSRLLARRAGLDGLAVRDGRLTRDDVARATEVVAAAGERGPAPILIDGRGQSVETIAGQIRSVVAQHGCHLVLVDYLQCIRTERVCDNRRAEINHVARTLTDAIKTSGAGGILASQLTGEDLRESRDVEHAAEVVLIGRKEENGDMALMVKKNKTGPRGGVTALTLDARTGALRESSPSDGYGLDDGTSAAWSYDE